MGCASGKDASDTTVATVDVGSALNSPEELTGMPKFPEGTTSELSKCLTPDVWKKCAGKKDALGVSFERCIFTGCKNVSS